MTRCARLGCGLAALLAIVSCRGPQRDVARAAALAEPHLEAFARFEGWARRAEHGREVMADGEALGETLFAPLRNDRGVLAAWVVQGGPRPQTHALPRGIELPALSGWVSLRAGELGEVQVVAVERCPLELPRWWRGDVSEAACVLVAREGAQLTVTVAFAPTEQGHAD